MKNKTIIIEKTKVKNFSKRIDEVIKEVILNSYNFKHNLFDKIKVFNTISFLSLLQEDFMCYDIDNITEDYECYCKNKFEVKLIEEIIENI